MGNNENRKVLYTFSGKDFKQLCEETMKEQLNEFNERFVLKVDNGTPAPIAAPAFPPQTPPQMPPMEGDTTPEPEIPGNEGNFDDEPDNGDEGNNPRKSIEKATGTLAHDLREYQQNHDDANELCKYVLGMIVSAGAGILSDKEKDEVIKKINKAQGNDQEQPEQEIPGDNPNPQPGQQPQGQPGPEQPVNELLTNMEDDNKYEESPLRPMGSRVQKKKPFMSKF